MAQNTSYANRSTPISKSRISVIPKTASASESPREFFSDYSLSRYTKSEPLRCGPEKWVSDAPAILGTQPDK